jgi:indole-3-glycerol phosphate synthase
MILDRIVAQTRITVARARQAVPLSRLESEARAAPRPRDFTGALRSGRIGCIAEFKRRSPSAGWLREGAEPAQIATRYQAAGAAALSILTDGPFFSGSLTDLRRAREATALPVLRKDFIVDPYQVVEARAAGADAILLIVSALTDPALGALMAEAGRWGLHVLCEAHDEPEIERALAASARIVGINQRDLRTFEVDTTLALRLRSRVPHGRIVVAESGIRSAADVERLRAGGVDAILVGEALMRAPDPGLALKQLLTPPP